MARESAERLRTGALVIAKPLSFDLERRELTENLPIAGMSIAANSNRSATNIRIS